MDFITHSSTCVISLRSASSSRFDVEHAGDGIIIVVVVVSGHPSHEVVVVSAVVARVVSHRAPRASSSSEKTRCLGDNTRRGVSPRRIFDAGSHGQDCRRRRLRVREQRALKKKNNNPPRPFCVHVFAPHTFVAADCVVPPITVVPQPQHRLRARPHAEDVRSISCAAGTGARSRRHRRGPQPRL